MVQILVDADAVAFRAAAAVEKEQWVKTVTIEDGYPVEPWNMRYPKGTRKSDIEINDGDTVVREKIVGSEEDALHLVRGMMSSILAEFPDDASVKLFFTPMTKKCFRYTLYPEYKANRTKARPIHLEAVRNYLMATYAFSMMDHLEADDLLVDAMTETTVLVHNDKDLDQAVGKHYNFVSHTHYEVGPEEAMYLLHTQVLTGDRADNIIGIKGMGPAGAEKALAGCTTEAEFKDAVVYCYEKAGYKMDYLSLQYALVTLGEPGHDALDECFVLYYSTP